MGIKAYAVALMLALTGCATDQQGIRTVLVPSPTPVACVDPAQVPAEPPQVGSQLTGDAVHDLGIVAPSALELRACSGSHSYLLKVEVLAIAFVPPQSR